MFQDLRFAVRMLRKSPGFTLTVVLSLALGIGATTAVFSIVRAVSLRPLPYAPADRVVMIAERDSLGENRLASYPTFEDWRAEAAGFEVMAFVRGRGVVLDAGSGAERLLGGFVSEDFFRVMPVPALVGRALWLDDMRPGAPAVAVLSYQLWNRRFNGERAVVGRSVVLGDRSYTIVGIMPPGFQYPTWADLWAPLASIEATEPALRQRDLHVDSRIIGRLRAGTDSVAGRRSLELVAGRLAQAYPAESGGWRSIAMYPLAAEVVGNVAPRLKLLSAAAAFVLLIVLANVANLSLARLAARHRELAIRAALGVRRRGLVLLLASELLLLVGAGSGLGLLGAAAAVAWVRIHAREVLPRVDEITIDGDAVAFTLVLATLTLVVLALLPALRRAPTQLSDELKEDGAGSGTGRSKQRLRAALVVAECAMALMLVAGAGLLVRSLWRLQQVDAGFRSADLLVVPVYPPSPRYDDPQRALQLYQRAAEAAAAVPGVRSVALTNHIPLSGASAPTRLEIDGRLGADAADQALFRVVDTSYFSTLRIPVLAGRVFSDQDMLRPGDGIVINRTLAHRYWPGASALGQRVTVFKKAQGRADFGEPIHATVIGVVGDVRHFGLDADFVPEVYLPYTLAVWPQMSVVARVDRDAERVRARLRDAVLAVEPELPLAGPSYGDGVHSVNELLSETLAQRRLTAGVLTAFTAVALFLAGLGIYGIISYAVAQRRREIGVRIAFGARRTDILRLVLGQGARLVLSGTVLGIGGALAVTRLLASQLYEVAPADPVAFLAAAASLAAVGLVASGLPAWRATLVDPNHAIQGQ